MNWINSLNSYGKQRIPYAFFIDFLGESAELFALNTLHQHQVFMSFPNFQNLNFASNNSDIQIHPKYPDLETYKKSFDKIQYHLNQGDSYLCNLTFSTPIELNLSLDEIFPIVKAKYKILFQQDWLCFSPETFVKIKDNRISTFPMKGTIDANLPNAAETLLNSKKEKAEHYTIVDLLRNDLSQVAKNVKVDRLMYLEEIRTQKGKILQMSSEISGNLEENWQDTLGDILKKLLPAGSISGAPKNKTLEIIKEAENHTRNFYTGIAGVFDGENLDTCVLIRFIEKSDEKYIYKSGGGITAMSKLEDEYNEIKQKIYVPVF